MSEWQPGYRTPKGGIPLAAAAGDLAQSHTSAGHHIHVGQLCSSRCKVPVLTLCLPSLSRSLPLTLSRTRRRLPHKTDRAVVRCAGARGSGVPLRLEPGWPRGQGHGVLLQGQARPHPQHHGRWVARGLQGLGGGVKASGGAGGGGGACCSVACAWAGCDNHACGCKAEGWPAGWLWLGRDSPCAAHRLNPPAARWLPQHSQAGSSGCRRSR